MNRGLEMAKEVEKLFFEGMSIDEAYITVLEMYNEKTRNTADQSNSYEDIKSINDIIPSGTDLDNGEVYDEYTGETVKEL